MVLLRILAVPKRMCVSVLYAPAEFENKEQARIGNSNLQGKVRELFMEPVESVVPLLVPSLFAGNIRGCADS